MNASLKLGWNLGLLGLVGCATRELPVHHAEGSPLSLDAAVAAPPVVTRSLDGEPPLPGTSQDAGWVGLHEGKSAATRAHSHQEHGGHGHEP